MPYRAGRLLLLIQTLVILLTRLVKIFLNIPYQYTLRTWAAFLEVAVCSVVAVTPCAALWFLFGAPLTHQYQTRVKYNDKESVSSNSIHGNPNTARKISERSNLSDHPVGVAGGGGHVGGGGYVNSNIISKLKPIREDQRFVKVFL